MSLIRAKGWFFVSIQSDTEILLSYCFGVILVIVIFATRSVLVDTLSSDVGFAFDVCLLPGIYFNVMMFWHLLANAFP